MVFVLYHGAIRGVGQTRHFTALGLRHGRHCLSYRHHLYVDNSFVLADRIEVRVILV